MDTYKNSSVNNAMIDYGTEYPDPSVTPTVKNIVSLNKNTENHILTSVTRGTLIS